MHFTMIVKLTAVQFHKKLYRQYGVLVDHKDAQHTKSDWLAIQTAQEHIYLNIPRHS